MLRNRHKTADDESGTRERTHEQQRAARAAHALAAYTRATRRTVERLARARAPAARAPAARARSAWARSAWARSARARSAWARSASTNGLGPVGMARSAWRGRHGTRSASARSATARTGWAWLAWARSACAHWQARSVHESRKRAREKMKRVGKRTRESAGGATGPRCRAVVEEQAARRAGAMRCDREHNKPAQSGFPSASVRCLCARRSAVQQGCTRMLWAGSRFCIAERGPFESSQT